MSSESEDEFQSADEGSDLEDLECNPEVLAQPSPPRVNVALCEKVTKIGKDETCSDTGKEEISKDAANLGAAVNDGKSTSDTHERTETVKIPEKTYSADASFTSDGDESVSRPMSELSITGSKSVEEKALNKSEFSKCSENITEVWERAAVCVEKQQETCMKQESIHKETYKSHPKEHACGIETDKVQPKEMFKNNEGKIVTEELEGESGNKSDVSSGATLAENTKPESTADEPGILAPSSKPKPIKQSKIGMKKPREKLGERIGARKLDVKVAHKSTASSISVDTKRPKEEESENVSALDKKSQIGKGAEDGREEDEKSKKRQQWEEQQERWHQALNLGKDRKEASLGNDDGWSVPWGGWGNTLLSAATTFTREMGRGVGTVMETVESSIGAPSPEVMAEEVIKQEDKRKALEESTAPQGAGEGEEAEEKKCAGSEEGSVVGDRSGEQTGASYGLGGFSLGSLVSGVSGALETASSKVLLGGLDTLEVIGRKAMDVIQEGDPGLERKRAFLSNKKPNLAQVLQEARQRAAEEERDGLIEGRSAKNSQKPSFEQAWEGTEGPVHLEALSLVAKQCQSKSVSLAASLPHYVQNQLHGENTVIMSSYELEDDNVLVEKDLAEVISSVLAQMGLPLHPQKLIDAWTSVQEKAAFFKEAGFEEREKAEKELYGALAELVSQLCTVAHKGGELALITPETDPSHVAFHFKKLAQAVSGSLENITDQVCDTITTGASAADPRVDDTITHIYIQAASGNNYIQRSVLLLASVLQYSNTKLAATNL